MATEGPRIPAEALGNQPLGGAETAFALLAQAFHKAGHAVEVRSGTAPAETLHGIVWAPLGTSSRAPDLVITNRGPRLFRVLPRARRRVLWLHNPATYLRKLRHALPVLLARPMLVTLGPSHAATLPRWLPGRRVQIPLAVAPPFDAPSRLRPPPPPVAIFTSNPLRGLDWLLDLWQHRIHPAVPGAELHLYSGAATYGGDPGLAARAAPALARAEAMAALGVRRFDPLPRPALAARLAGARAMLYRGDSGETFCLAIAEAQALGLPCLVTALGAVTERIVDGETGLVAADDGQFATAAIQLLSDDATWSRLHSGALARGSGPTWAQIAARFVALAA